MSQYHDTIKPVWKDLKKCVISPAARGGKIQGVPAEQIRHFNLDCVYAGKWYMGRGTNVTPIAVPIIRAL